MILAQQNNLNQINTSCNCGTISKCSMCVYKLICERSPYCCIKNGSCDLTPVVNALQQLESAMVNQFNNLNSNINSVGEKLNSMDSSIATIGEVVNTINTKVDEILNKPSVTNNSIEPVNAEILSNEEQGLVPLSQSDTVLVEKKNLFGKSKWVEEKSKK